ncbi:exonuclease domain-containing protein [Lactobacillus kimbladii]|uniref:exonuclease domain-containing protein n=1 Tax=Lactobacillus kimbladii TaxID=1218506 RepID=UPI003AF555C5
MSIYVKNSVLHVSGVQDKIRGKGQEWPDFISDYTMLDIETTGLNPYRDHVTELGAVKVRANKVVDEFSQLVVYPRSNHVPSFITKLNGITEDLLLEKGKPVKEAMTAFRTFIGDDIVIGYNVNFDLNFLYDLARKFHLPELSNNYVDVLRLARVYYPQQHNRLLDCIQRAGIAQVEQHHGLADSLDTKKVYDDFRQHFTPELLQEAQGKLKNIDLLQDELEVWELGFRNPVNNKKIAFAPEVEINGTEAAQMVNNMNGVAQTGVKADTDYLIMNDDGFFSKSNPETLKAKEFNHAGSKIKRLSESYFLNMLDEWARS